jgi:hypothetical protein
MNLAMLRRWSNGRSAQRFKGAKLIAHCDELAQRPLGPDSRGRNGAAWCFGCGSCGPRPRGLGRCRSTGSRPDGVIGTSLSVLPVLSFLAAIFAMEEGGLLRFMLVWTFRWKEVGRMVRETKVASEPNAITRELRTAPGDYVRDGVEAEPLSQWTRFRHKEAALPEMCIEARHAKAAMVAVNRHKNDRNHARSLAQLARSGSLKVVHAKSRPRQELRMLLTARELRSTIRGPRE